MVWYILLRPLRPELDGRQSFSWSNLRKHHQNQQEIEGLATMGNTNCVADGGCPHRADIVIANNSKYEPNVDVMFAIMADGRFLMAKFWMAMSHLKSSKLTKMGIFQSLVETELLWHQKEKFFTSIKNRISR
jgi:hypothetical protein